MSVELRYCGKHGTHDYCWHPANQPADHSIADEMLAELRRENAELRTILEECADDLQGWVEQEYDPNGEGVHPALERRYRRDMEPVEKARRALNPTEDE